MAISSIRQRQRHDTVPMSCLGNIGVLMLSTDARSPRGSRAKTRCLESRPTFEASALYRKDDLLLVTC